MSKYFRVARQDMELIDPEFHCYFYFIDWKHISLGISICLHGPSLEIHLPFGFFRIGRQYAYRFKDDE